MTTISNHGRQPLHVTTTIAVEITSDSLLPVGADLQLGIGERLVIRTGRDVEINFRDDTIEIRGL